MYRFVWKCLFVGVVLALAAPLSVRGAEFSAKMVLRKQGQDVLGRIFVKDGKMRQEFIDDRGRHHHVRRDNIGFG